MHAELDHVGIPATNPEAAAGFLAWVLGEGSIIPDGSPDEVSQDMFSLMLHGWSLVFVRATKPAPIHLAIRIGAHPFLRAIERLSAREIPFGNDPEDSTNGRTEDSLGGHGRVYFTDPDGHLYDLVAG